MLQSDAASVPDVQGNMRIRRMTTDQEARRLHVRSSLPAAISKDCSAACICACHAANLREVSANVREEWWLWRWLARDTIVKDGRRILVRLWCADTHAKSNGNGESKWDKPTKRQLETSPSNESKRNGSLAVAPCQPKSCPKHLVFPKSLTTFLRNTCRFSPPFAHASRAVPCASCKTPPFLHPSYLL